MSRTLRINGNRGIITSILLSYKGSLFLVMIAQLLVVGISSIQPIIIQNTLMALNNSSLFMKLLFLVLFLGIFQTILSTASSYYLSLKTQSASIELQTSAFSIGMSRPVFNSRFPDDNDVSNRIVYDSSTVSETTFATFIGIYKSVLLFAFCILAMIYIDPLSTAVVLAFLCIVGLTLFKNTKALRTSSERLRVAQVDVISHIESLLLARRVFILARRVSSARVQISKRLRSYYQVARQYSKLRATLGPAISSIAQLGLVVVLATAAWQASKTTSPVATVLAFMMYYSLLTPEITAISNYWFSIQACAVSKKRLQDLDTDDWPQIQHEADKASNSHRYPSKLSDPNRPHMIDLQNAVIRVTATHVIGPVSLTIDSGESVCIFGPSGTGKTTLLRAIEGLLPLESGTYSYKGSLVNMRTIGSFWDEIAVVDQDFPVTPRTVIDDIRIGNRQVTLSEAAELLDFVGLNRLSSTNGLDNKIYQNGAGLSAGERQRVSWVRTILSMKHLLIFDEPTSNIDQEGELVFCRLLDEFASNRAVLIVSHSKTISKWASKTIHIEDQRST